MRILILYHPDNERPEKESFGRFIQGCTSTCGTKRVDFGTAQDAGRYAIAHMRNPYTHVFAHLMAEVELANNFPGDVIRKAYTRNREPLYSKVFQAVRASSQTGDENIFINSVITEFTKFLAKTPLEAAADDLINFERSLDGYSHSEILTRIFGNIKQHVTEYANYLKKNNVSIDGVNRDYVRDIIKYYDSLYDGLPRQEIDHSDVIPVEKHDAQWGMENDKNGKSRLGIVGDNQLIKLIRDQIYRIFETQNRAIILGETGTGKDKVVEAFHILLQKKELHRNVPCITEVCTDSGDINIEKSKYFGEDIGFLRRINVRIGLIEAAHQGILFLDEFQEWSKDTQDFLMGFLAQETPPYTFSRQGGSYHMSDIKFLLFGTNKNFDILVNNGKIRYDMARRLGVNCITVPPLRDRRLDIPILVKYFCAINPNNQIQGFTREAMIALMVSDWTNNARGLSNVGGLRKVIDALNTRKYIDGCDLPTYIFSSNIPTGSQELESESELEKPGTEINPPLPCHSASVITKIERLKLDGTMYEDCLKKGIDHGGGYKGAVLVYIRDYQSKEIPPNTFGRQVKRFIDKCETLYNETGVDLLQEYPVVASYR